MIRHIKRGHTGTRLAPTYKGKYGKLKENNIGVFQGSAISALLFIIYLGDMMDDLEELNRRTDIPMRIVQDRPYQQKEALIWKETQEKQDEQDKYEEIIETHIVRNYTCENMHMEKIKQTKIRKLEEQKS